MLAVAVVDYANAVLVEPVMIITFQLSDACQMNNRFVLTASTLSTKWKHHVYLWLTSNICGCQIFFILRMYLYLYYPMSSLVQTRNPTKLEESHNHPSVEK